MTVKITHEMREALNRSADGAIRVEDDRSSASYFLVFEEKYRRLARLLNDFEQRENELRTAIGIGIDQLDRCLGQPWDADEIRRRARDLGPNTPDD